MKCSLDLWLLLETIIRYSLLKEGEKVKKTIRASSLIEHNHAIGMKPKSSGGTIYIYLII